MRQHPAPYRPQHQAGCHWTGASSLRLLYGGYTQPSMLEMFQVVQDSSAMAGVGDKSTAKPVRKYDLAATDREIHKSRPEAKTIFEALQELYPQLHLHPGLRYSPTHPRPTCRRPRGAEARMP